MMHRPCLRKHYHYVSISGDKVMEGKSLISSRPIVKERKMKLELNRATARGRIV